MTTTLIGQFSTHQRVLGYSRRTIGQRAWSLGLWERFLEGRDRNVYTATVGDVVEFLDRTNSSCHEGSGLAVRGRPDAFYDSVAAVYIEAIESGSRHPAQDVAALTDVPVSTVNRWVKEARRRGVLTPASAQGRPAGPRCSCRCPVHCPR